MFGDSRLRDPARVDVRSMVASNCKRLMIFRRRDKINVTSKLIRENFLCVHSQLRV